jgi:hypothetical protein
MLQAAGDDGVSSLQALRLAGIYRAGARIYQLRQEGWAIRTIRHNHRVATYMLERVA